MSEDARKNVDVKPDKTVIKALSQGGLLGGTGEVMVDVKDGKILRIRPFHFDWKYDGSTFRPWKIQRNGAVLEPGLKSRPAPYMTAYKKRTYSPNRILYPLKRVDWDPDGERNPQNRGVSKYERISWDEATDIIAKEIVRIQKTVRSQRDPRPGRRPRREQDHPHAARPQRPPARRDGRLHPAGPPAGQLGGLVLGLQARLGPRVPGHDGPAAQRRQGHHRALRDGPQVGLRRRDHAVGLHRPERHQHLLLLDRGGHQAGLHLPRPQLRRGRPRRQVDPGAPQQRRRPPARHHPRVAQGGLLGQGVRRDPRRRHGQGRGLRARRRRRRPEVARMGRAQVRRARVDHQGARPRVRRPSAPRSSTTSAAR